MTRALLFDLLQQENPEAYKKCVDAPLGGCTGSECNGLLQTELKKIPKESVSLQTFKMIQQLISDLDYRPVLRH
jgi:hypothetical protein